MKNSQKAVTLIELLVVVCIFFVMIAVLTPFMQMTKERAYRIKCVENLQRISLALHAYASDHNDAFPPDLAALYPNYIADETIFSCPTRKARGMEGLADYQYTAGLTEASPAQTILVQDAAKNHKKPGKHIVRVNGVIEWVNTAR